LEYPALSGSPLRLPLLDFLYHQFLEDQDAPGFMRKVTARYRPAALERLLTHKSRTCRRAAALALGYVGNYESNTALGRSLHDVDRGVRSLAENSMRAVWCRAGTPLQQQLLEHAIRSNVGKQFDKALVRSTELVELAPWFAEAWNQRAIAQYGLARYTESIGDCRQALEINPYHFGAAAGMGQCYLNLGDREEALDCFRRALRLNPELEGVRAAVQNLERAKRRRS
jgi:tetratricopeptide (TPR) repeat protein